MTSDFQSIIALGIVALAVVYLLRPLIFPRKRKKAGGGKCGSGNCGCK